MSVLYQSLQHSIDDFNLEMFQDLLRSHSLLLDASDMTQLVFDVLCDLYSIHDHSREVLAFLECLLEHGALIHEIVLIDLFDHRHVKVNSPSYDPSMRYPIEHVAMPDILKLVCKRQPATLHAINTEACDATVLLSAARSWPLSTIKTLIAIGADVMTSKDKDGRNILFYAAKNHHYGKDIIEYLSTHYDYQQLGIRDSYFRTPLMMCTHVNMMVMILEKYPMYSAKDRDITGCTVLHHVCARVGNQRDRVIAMIAFLLNEGVDINDNKNNKKRTPFMVLCQNHFPDRALMDYVARKFVDFDAKDLDGRRIIDYINQFIQSSAQYDMLIKIMHHVEAMSKNIQTVLIKRVLRINVENLVRIMYKDPQLDLPFDLILEIAEKCLVEVPKTPHVQSVIQSTLKAMSDARKVVV